MATENVIIHNGKRTAGADLSAKQFHAVKIGATNTIALCNAAGEAAYGILQDKPSSGRVGSVGIAGQSKAIVGGTVAAGDRLTVDANGKLVVGYGADRAIALALEAGNANDIIEVELVQGAPYAQHAPHNFTFSLDLAKLANGDLITGMVPGYAGRIKSFRSSVLVAATTPAKTATLNLEIGTTDVTGGVLALTSANCTPIGKVNAATAITALNTFSATGAISVEVSGVDAFIEGEATFTIEFA